MDTQGHCIGRDPSQLQEVFKPRSCCPWPQPLSPPPSSQGGHLPPGCSTPSAGSEGLPCAACPVHRVTPRALRYPCPTLGSWQPFRKESPGPAGRGRRVTRGSQVWSDQSPGLEGSRGSDRRVMCPGHRARTCQSRGPGLQAHCRHPLIYKGLAWRFLLSFPAKESCTRKPGSERHGHGRLRQGWCSWARPAGVAAWSQLRPVIQFPVETQKAQGGQAGGLGSPSTSWWAWDRTWPLGAHHPSPELSMVLSGAEAAESVPSSPVSSLGGALSPASSAGAGAHWLEPAPTPSRSQSWPRGGASAVSAFPGTVLRSRAKLGAR